MAAWLAAVFSSESAANVLVHLSHSFPLPHTSLNPPITPFNVCAECFARSTPYEALERDPRVGEALQVVREKGFAEKAREFAAQALMARRSGVGSVF